MIADFTLADLQYGDTVIVLHDTHAVRIDAERTSKAKGTITNIIPGARKITDSAPRRRLPIINFFTYPMQCKTDIGWKTMLNSMNYSLPTLSNCNVRRHGPQRT